MSTIDPAAVSIEDIDDTRTPTSGAYGEPRTFGSAERPATQSIRQSLREDASTGRAWARDKGQALETAIRAEPVKSAAYAVGAGLLLGLLLKR